MRRLAVWGCLTVAAALPAAAQAACAIADPTGTPLNLRSSPNGAITGTLPNGLAVEPLEERMLGAKRWLRIAVDAVPRGWVFGAYVHCDDGGDDERKSAPMRPRVAPN